MSARDSQQQDQPDRVTVTMDATVRRKLDELAQSCDVSRSWMVEQAVRRMLDMPALEIRHVKDG